MKNKRRCVAITLQDAFANYCSIGQYWAIVPDFRDIKVVYIGNGMGFTGYTPVVATTVITAFYFHDYSD